MTSSEIKKWFKKTIKSNNENLSGTKEYYLQTISPDFEFHANDENCNFREWYQRFCNFKKNLKTIHLSFQEVIVEGNTVAANYCLNITKLDGSQAEVKIIGFFRFKRKKLIYCDELYWVVKGTL